MKIGTNRIILSCVFSCLAFVLTTNGDAQLRSIVFAQSEGAGVAQLSQEELSPRLNDQRVMHVNQPSDDSSVFATSHLSEPEQLPPTPSVSIVQLDEVQYGSPIAPGVTVFEVKNFGTEDVRDVNIEIAVENSARMLSIEPATTIIAAKAARVELNSIPAGQSKLVKIHSASGNGNPVEYTTRVLVEAAEQLGTNDAQSVALPVNPIPRNPIPLNPVPRKADQDSSVMHQGPPVDLATAGPNELLNEIASDSIRETPAPPEDPVIIEVETPNQFILGVPYRVYATVLNPTQSSLSNLQITLRSSGQLRSTPGFASFQTVASIASRHSARFEFEVFGIEPGDAELYFGATAKFENDGEDQTSETENPLIKLGTSEIIEIFKPAIRAKFEGPEFVHVGTEATYAIEVINESGSLLAATDVLLNVPDHLVVTVLDRIAYKRNTGQIRWRVEHLEPGKSELIQFKAKAMQPGMQTQQVDLAIQNRVFAQGTCHTNILGPSKLQVELRDLYSAVPIGEVAKLKVNIKNHDDYANELKVKVRLPEGVHAVNSEHLQSNGHNEVLFKPFVVDRKSDMQLEIPLVGSVIGGQAIEATVTSNTTWISRTTKRVVIFVNAEHAHLNSVAEVGPPMTAEPVVAGPVNTTPTTPVSEIVDSFHAAKRTARPASEFSSDMLSSASRRLRELHATVPQPNAPKTTIQPVSQSEMTSLAPSGYPETDQPEAHLSRNLPSRMRPLIASRRSETNEEYQSSSLPVNSPSNRRQQDTSMPPTSLPSSAEPWAAQPASTSILENNR